MPKKSVDPVVELRRAKLKTAAKLRAEVNFELALMRVDHKLDVLEPALAELDALAAAGKALELGA